MQPIIAKQILPWFGGSAAVWTTCLVFFQSVLLAGYAYADWTTRLGARRQAMLHGALLALSLLCLPILASSGWKPHGDEEPIPAENVEAYKYITDSTSTPICAGENLYLAYGFRRLLEMTAMESFSWG